MKSKGYEIIKQSLDDIVNSMPDPEKEPDWKALISRIEREEKTRHTKKVKFLSNTRRYAVAAAIFLIIAVYFGAGTTNAKNMLFSNIFYNVKQSIGTIFKITTDRHMDQSELDNEQNNASMEKITTKDMQEAKTLSDGKIKAPAYLPVNYELKAITIYKEENQIYNIILEYTDENGNDLKLREIPIVGGNTFAINYKKEGTDVVEVQDGEVKYIILSFENGYSKLIWDKYDMNYMLTGSLSKDEMLKIAKSI